MKAMLQVFEERIRKEFLPQFCDDPTRAYGPDGFKPEWHKVSDLALLIFFVVSTVAW
jgi:hypothetical protein